MPGIHIQGWHLSVAKRKNLGGRKGWAKDSNVFLVGGFKHEWIMFHFIYGMSSFPSTNSYFSRWLLHHQPVYMNIAQKKSLTPGIHCLSSELDQFCASVAGCQTLWGTTVAMYPTKTSQQRRMVSIRGNYPKNSGSVRFLKYLICPDTVGAKHCETIIVFLCTKDM